MPRNAGDALDVEHAIPRHLVPLRDGLGRNAKFFREDGGGASLGDRADQSSAFICHIAMKT